MIELFTPGRAYFARTLGVNNLRAHFNQMEKALRSRVGHDVTDVSEHITEARRSSHGDEIFSTSSCSAAAPTRARARSGDGQGRIFPSGRPRRSRSTRSARPTATCSTCSRRPSQRKNPLFTLPMYYPLAWYKGPDKSIDPFEKNRQKQVVGLIRTNFLKRFESSVARSSCPATACCRSSSASRGPQRDRRREEALSAGRPRTPRSSATRVQRQLELWGEDGDEPRTRTSSPRRCWTPSSASTARSTTSRDDVRDLPRPRSDRAVLDEARKFEPKHDDKLQKLIRLLKSKELAGQKVLIFTEFADTARYLKRRQLDQAGIEGVEQVDSATKANRADVIQRFSPYYNGFSSAELLEAGPHEIRVLISTDVLSEGLNLQDASRMINYDIHWNPVRLMQRIGRVDRRMNPEVEKAAVADHPEVASSRARSASGTSCRPTS
jgi:hypothetical protein